MIIFIILCIGVLIITCVFCIIDFDKRKVVKGLQENKYYEKDGWAILQISDTQFIVRDVDNYGIQETHDDFNEAYQHFKHATIDC